MHINLNNVRTTIRDLTRVAHTCNTSYCHNKNELCPLAIAAGAIVCTTQSRTRLGGATFKFQFIYLFIYLELRSPPQQSGGHASYQGAPPPTIIMGWSFIVPCPHQGPIVSLSVSFYTSRMELSVTVCTCMYNFN